MAENKPRIQATAEAATFRERKLNLTNGTLYIVEQAHAHGYNPDVITTDVESIQPQVMILENVAVVTPGMPGDFVVSPELIHQLDLAAKLNLPVVFPDVVGSEKRPIDEITKTSPTTTSLLLDFQEVQKYYTEIYPQEVTQLINSVALGSGLISLGLFALAGQLEKGRPLIHRRQLLKILAGSLAGAAVGYLASQATFGTFPQSAVDSSLSTSGPLNTRFVDRIEAAMQDYTYNRWGDREEAFKCVLKLRNAKYVSTAELVAEYFHNEKQIDNPSLALLVGQAHSSYLEDQSRHSTAENRRQTTREVLDTIIMPMYRLFQESVGNNPVLQHELYYYTCHELIRIASSTIHTVHTPQLGSNIRTLTMERAFVSPEIDAAIVEALNNNNDPILLNFYSSVINRLQTARSMPKDKRTFDLAEFKGDSV